MLYNVTKNFIRPLPPTVVCLIAVNVGAVPLAAGLDPGLGLEDAVDTAPGLEAHLPAESVGVVPLVWRTVETGRAMMTITAGVVTPAWRTVETRRVTMMITAGVVTPAWRTVETRRTITAGVVTPAWKAVETGRATEVVVLAGGIVTMYVQPLSFV